MGIYSTMQWLRLLWYHLWSTFKSFLDDLGSESFQLCLNESEQLQCGLNVYWSNTFTWLEAQIKKNGLSCGFHYKSLILNDFLYSFFLKLTFKRVWLMTGNDMKGVERIFLFSTETHLANFFLFKALPSPPPISQSLSSISSMKTNVPMESSMPNPSP